jgi:hypothetical protein
MHDRTNGVLRELSRNQETGVRESGLASTPRRFWRGLRGHKSSLQISVGMGVMLVFLYAGPIEIAYVGDEKTNTLHPKRRPGGEHRDEM